MSQLSVEGQRIVGAAATRHGFSEEAVLHMVVALANGGGTQAQFSHPEFGGMGQWSLGGMTMVGDMFNNQMKSRVDGLCSDLSRSVQGAQVFAARSSQSQSQGGFSGQYQGGGSSLFVPQASDWPAELGQPASQGTQNDMRYGYFPAKRRLAIAVAGRVTVYDTGDHQIGGFGQSQSGDQSLTFTSQHGVVRVADLPVVDVEQQEDKPDRPEAAPAAAPTPAPPTTPQPPSPARTDNGGDEQIFARLERLADFHARGILSNEEFDAKKAELLARL